MVQKATAIHKNNKYKVFKPNSLFCNNKNIRNACPKLPSLTVPNKKYRAKLAIYFLLGKHEKYVKNK